MLHQSGSSSFIKLHSFLKLASYPLGVCNVVILGNLWAHGSSVSAAFGHTMADKAMMQSIVYID